jgi:hypothetical protein
VIALIRKTTEAWQGGRKKVIGESADAFKELPPTHFALLIFFSVPSVPPW